MAWQGSQARQMVTGSAPALHQAPSPVVAPITVVVAEEQEVVRRGLIALLEEDETLRVCAGPLDGRGADGADVAVVSASSANRTGWGCAVIVCTDSVRGPALGDGAGHVVGVLPRRNLTGEQLRATVRAAAAGLNVHARPEPGSDPATLASRDRRVLELVADGLSTREIAEVLSYSERTIKKLIAALEQRLGARNRAHLVACAIRLGLI